MWSSPDRRRWLPLAIGAGAALAIGLGLSFSSSGLKLLLLAVVGGTAGVAILAQPYLGIFILVLTLQQIGWTRSLVQLGPLSFIDVVTLATFAGVAVSRHGKSHSRGVGHDSTGLRLAILFALVVVLSMLYAPHLRSSFREAQKLIGFIGVLYLTVRLAPDTRRIRWLVIALVVSTAASAAVASADFMLGTDFGRLGEGPMVSAGKRLAGTAGLAGPSSKMMVAGTALAAMLALRIRSWRWIAAGAAALGVAGVTTTGTRASLLVLALGFLWILFKFRRHRHFPAIILLVPALALGAFAMVPEYGMSRLASLTEPGQDRTTLQRITMYLIGLDLVPDSPLLGIGPGQFPKHYIDFEYRFLPAEREEGMPLHNTPLAVLVEEGLLGLVFFLGLLWVAWRGVRWVQRHAEDLEQRHLAEAIEFALVSYLITSMTGPNHRQMIFWILIALALAIARATRRSLQEAERSAPDEDRRRALLAYPGA